MTLDHFLLLLKHEAEHLKAQGVDLRDVIVNVDDDNCTRGVAEIMVNPDREHGPFLKLVLDA